MLAESYNH